MKKRNIDRVMSFTATSLSILWRHIEPIPYHTATSQHVTFGFVYMEWICSDVPSDWILEWKHVVCFNICQIVLILYLALLTSGSTLIQVGYILPCWLLRFTKRLSTFYIMVDLHRSLCLHSPILGMLRNWTRVNWRDGWTKRKPWKTVANLKT